MPVGSPVYFEGEISVIGPGTGYDIIGNIFGFLEGKVITPKEMKIPLLQTRVKMNKGFRTIAPLGEWVGTFYSEEIDNALKYGYQFHIQKGYLFERANIFKDYVDFLYHLKVNSQIGTPDFIIAK